MNPVCVKCCLEMTCTKTGALVAPVENPNHCRSGDTFTCNGCGASVVAGISSGAFAYPGGACLMVLGHVAESDEVRRVFGLDDKGVL